MINLIPIEEKKAIRIDFYIRVLIILFLMLGFSIFAGAVAMLPTYIYSHSKASDLNKKFETQKNEIMPQVDQQAQSDINNLNNKL